MGASWVGVAEEKGSVKASGIPYQVPRMSPPFLKFDLGHLLRLLLFGQNIPLRRTGEGYPCLVLSI